MVREFENISLSGRNSFGVEASARRLIEYDEPDSLIELLHSRNDIRNGRMAVIGGGNNILFTGDFEGTLIHSTGKTFRITHENTSEIKIYADAGMEWDDFVERCTESEAWGAENLSAIPGSVGAAPVQNIGAYGAEARDIIESVEIIDLQTLKRTTIAGEHCSFGYRDSIFKTVLRNKAVITGVNFRLLKQSSPNLSYGALSVLAAKHTHLTPKAIRQEVIAIRQGKLPDPKTLGNAGSFFKNPTVDSATALKLKELYPDMPQYATGDSSQIKLSAGWLIEKAGWKGSSRGKAGVYEKQALVLVNLGGATGCEIVAFSEEIRRSIHDKFGVEIQSEVNIW